jgi:hypothetical protein
MHLLDRKQPPNRDASRCEKSGYVFAPTRGSAAARRAAGGPNRLKSNGRKGLVFSGRPCRFRAASRGGVKGWVFALGFKHFAFPRANSSWARTSARIHPARPAARRPSGASRKCVPKLAAGNELRRSDGVWLRGCHFSFSFPLFPRRGPTAATNRRRVRGTTARPLRRSGGVVVRFTHPTRYRPWPQSSGEQGAFHAPYALSPVPVIQRRASSPAKRVGGNRKRAHPRECLQTFPGMGPFCYLLRNRFRRCGYPCHSGTLRVVRFYWNYMKPFLDSQGRKLDSRSPLRHA